jgi:hypothetical protein
MSEARLSALTSLLLVVQGGIRSIRQMTSEDAESFMAWPSLTGSVEFLVWEIASAFGLAMTKSGFLLPSTSSPDYDVRGQARGYEFTW